MAYKQMTKKEVKSFLTVRLDQMPQITWDNRYSVNNEQLDNHHKKLFSIFNRIYDEYIHADNTDCISAIIDQLVSYADYHFEAEEKYMAKIGYKDIDNHIQMHRYFTQKTFEMRQLNNNDYELTKNLIDFLGAWLCQHVMEEDKKISTALSNNKG